MTPAAQPRAVLIQNPASGRGDWDEHVVVAIQTFLRAGWDVRHLRTSAPGDATTMAREAVRSGHDIVVVAGGDGTVNEALQGLAGQRHTALAVLPGGTVNVWATELGAGQRLEELAAEIARGRRRVVDLGLVNDRYFLMMASAGFDAQASAEVKGAVMKELKRKAGPLAYVVSAFRTAFRFRVREATVEIDGEVVTGSLLMLIAGNTRLYGGVTEITYQARADDGLLDIVLLIGRGPLDLLRRGWSVLRRRHHGDTGIVYRQARKAVLRPAQPLQIQADGEDIGLTPATFEVAPRALEVIVYSDDLPGFLSPDESTPPWWQRR